LSPPDILIVDDDPRLREVVRYTLSREGHDVREAGDGQAALDAVAAQVPDLIVLDVLMPELDGLEVCRRVRATSRVPIIFLSSRSEELDRVLGLELGGDDYLAKPFSPRELASRVKAVLRRSEPVQEATPAPATERLQHGRLVLDLTEHRAWVDGDEVVFTVTELRLLASLLRHPGKVYTRDELVERAYDGKHFVSDRTIDSHVRRIRQKLRDHDLDPIETVHGLGFRLQKPRS